jgi:hypothetical protein
MTIEGRLGSSNESEQQRLVRDIREWENNDIRELMTNLGLIGAGDEITSEDYEATKNRAEVLMKEARGAGSVEDFLVPAFIDRMEIVSKISHEDIHNLSDDMLRRLVFIESGLSMTEEEIELCRKSDLGLSDWAKKRAMIAQKGKTSRDFITVDENKDTVLAMGNSREQAARAARQVKQGETESSGV